MGWRYHVFLPDFGFAGHILCLAGSVSSVWRCDRAGQHSANQWYLYRRHVETDWRQGMPSITQLVNYLTCNMAVLLQNYSKHGMWMYTEHLSQRKGFQPELNQLLQRAGKFGRNAWLVSDTDVWPQWCLKHDTFPSCLNFLSNKQGPGIEFIW